MKYGFTFYLIFFISLGTALLAQNSGRIYGVISDAETEKPLSGVRVIVNEKAWGVDSDSAGFYILMPLPMSTYTLTIACPGYQSLTIEEVQVISGDGTRLHISLTPTDVDTEHFLIRAERSWAEESIPYAYSRISAAEIQQLPIRGLHSYMELQPGVVIQDKNVHIRGGRDDETGYFVNGFSTMDPLDNSNGMYVIPEAIERLEILPGFFPARYGGVNSGLVFTELKKGTPEYRFSADYQTDKFAEAGEKFFGTYTYRDHIFTATAGGPMYLNDLYFFVAVENLNITRLESITTSEATLGIAVAEDGVGGIVRSAYVTGHHAYGVAQFIGQLRHVDNPCRRAK